MSARSTNICGSAVLVTSVITDGSGIAFVKPEDIARVLDAAESIAAREVAMAQALRAGRPITEVMGANYEYMLNS